jgi:hypothetical protein
MPMPGRHHNCNGPTVGAILAMVVTRGFDPNTVAALTPDRWRNRA